MSHFMYRSICSCMVCIYIYISIINKSISCLNFRYSLPFITS
nr:MAG TPA: hypothetical protein [Caudoviricetes sp.]